MDSPRERHEETWSGWVEGVTLERLVPLDWADVIQMAVTRSLHEGLHAPSGGSRGSSARERYEVLGRAVGLRRETLRATYHGARWVTLPELVRLEVSALTGPPLRHYLARLATRTHRLDQDPGPTHPRHWIDSSMRAEHLRVPAPSGEGVATDALTVSEVAPTIGRSERHTSCDRCVRTAMQNAGLKRTTHAAVEAPKPHETLVSMVRGVMEQHRPMQTYQVVLLVQQRRSNVSYKQIQDALTRLVRQGELQVVGRGNYRSKGGCKTAY